MKHAKLIAVAVLGMAFLGAGAASASPVRPDDGKTGVSAKAEVIITNIADAISVPVGTVRSRIHRGRRLLRAALQ